MGFLLPHYEYDAFVSYSHGIRGGETEMPLRDWTLDLIHRLSADIRLVDQEFDALEIWVDEQLDPTIHLNDELRAKVRQSGILMIVMSPRYLSSTWCKEELGWFRQQVADRSRDQGRVFVIRALPTDENTWPEFLRDEQGNALVGFSFHDPHDPMPYGWRGSYEKNEAYVRQLGRLRTAVINRLRELRTKTEHRIKLSISAIAPSCKNRRIYLHARSNDVPVCDHLKKVLRDDGLEPLTSVIDPGRDLADLTRESRIRIQTALRCDALALVRGDDDPAFVGDLIDVGIKERERIQIARGAPLPCAVLDRTGEVLPIDVSGYEIERFDLRSEDWRNHFRGWLDHSGGQSAPV